MSDQDKAQKSQDVAAQKTTDVNQPQTPNESDLKRLERQLNEIDRRLARIEKKTKTNEQFARTISASLSTQVIAVDAVTKILRHALTSDAQIQEELSQAIRTYDRRKFRRWCSGFLGVLLWVGSIAGAAVVGALIHWLFGTA